MFIAIGLFIGLAMLAAGMIISRSKPDPAKNSPYECGFEPFEDARAPFDVRYYLVAIVFIIFDLEFAFFFPWAMVLKEIGAPALAAMGLFLAVLVAGFIYEWKQGALEWE